PRCGAAAQSDRFVDGGVFDNTPLRLAVTTVARGLQASGGTLSWTPVPARSAKPGAVMFLSVDKDNTPFAPLAAPSGDTNPAALGLLATFASTGGNAAMAKERYTLAEENPDATIEITPRALPSPSEHLAHFFGSSTGVSASSTSTWGCTT